MTIIYFFTAIIATTLGSLAGLGGGVIIKPVLDTLNHFDLSSVSILSSCTVFAMALISTFKQMKNGFQVQKQMIILSIGSILGGILGKHFFDLFLKLFTDEQIGKGIQALILSVLLIITLLKNKLPKYKISNFYFIFFLGLFLGGTASFLGIGGGPVNVAILVIFMSLPTKIAAINSVFIILLSQFSKLSLLILESKLQAVDMKILLFMVIGGILGGILGAKLNKILSEEMIEKIFSISVFGIIALNVFNAIKAFA